jgi:NAD(P)H-dependent flavin oxidoreductase YrpB (nitropropane dioxygenase family)
MLPTPLTKLLGIKHTILLAGMNVAAGPELAAAVTNSGGLGVIGGVGYTPEFLRKQIENLKSFLVDKNAPFGIDLLLPQVGSGARKTNYDYTEVLLALRNAAPSFNAIPIATDTCTGNAARAD